MPTNASLTIASWNIENLAPYLAADAPHTMPDVLEQLGRPDVLCLQEVRIRPQDDDLVRALQTALPGYRCDASLNRDRRNAGFRGGRAYGVATYTRSALQGIGLHWPWDLEGRVIATVLPTLAWVVVNVYAVNGTSRPYVDPVDGTPSGDRHAFKRRFIEQLGHECQALRNAGFELVLIGDWNVSRTALDTFPRLRTEQPHALARAAFNEQFMPGLDLRDVFRERHRHARRYTWFNRRARGGRLDAARVDFALVSASLMPRVNRTDIQVEPPAGRSDHVPLWIGLDASDIHPLPGR